MVRSCDSGCKFRKCLFLAFCIKLKESSQIRGKAAKEQKSYRQKAKLGYKFDYQNVGLPYAYLEDVTLKNSDLHSMFEHVVR